VAGVAVQTEAVEVLVVIETLYPEKLQVAVVRQNLLLILLLVLFIL
jgi:hypothetical protein